MELNTNIERQAIAQQLGIVLDNQALAILEILEKFYTTYNHMPNRRAFTNFAKPLLAQQNIDISALSSINLMQKFGEKPIKNMAIITGLPEPENCL